MSQHLAPGCLFMGLLGFVSAEGFAQDPKDPYKVSRLTRDESEVRADKRKLRLTTGEDKAVDMNFEVNAGANGISIGNPKVVATTLVKIGERGQIVFKPLSPGATNVTVRDNDGTIRLIFNVLITGTNLSRVVEELRKLLQDIEGIEIRVVGQKVVVDGEVLIPTDFGRLLSIISDKSYADVVLNLTTLSPLAAETLRKRIQEDINAFAPNVKTRLVNGMIFLEGSVDNADQAKRAGEVAKLYLPELKPGNQLERDPTAQRLPPRSLVQNFIVINPPPPRKQEKLVRVTVHFVELAKDYNRIFGFKWEPGFTADPQIAIGQTQAGGAGTGSPGASFSATISSLFPKLQSAQAAGYARILRTGTIVVRSGQAASFEQQMELPFAQQGPNGQVTSASKAVGISMATTPTILGQSEDIQMQLDLTQVNLVGRAPAAGGPPVTSSRKVKTNLYVRANESAAVSGVVSDDVGTDFNKDDPRQGQFAQGTEPLFTLLRSKAYRKKKSQFVVFVTPQIVENASDGTDDLKRNFRIKAH